MITFVLISVLFMPWIPVMLKQIWTVQSWREGHGAIAAGEQLFEFINDISLGFYYRFEKNTLIFIAQGISIFVAAVFFLGLVRILASSAGGMAQLQLVSSQTSKLIGLLVLFPLISSILIAIFRLIEFFRYLSIIIPYVLIMGFVALEGMSVKLRVSILLLFFAMNIYGDWLYFKNDFKNNDYRQVVLDIRNQAEPGVRIFIYPFYYRLVLQYYQTHGGLPEISDYGYEYSRLMEKLKAYKGGETFLILDYSIPDTTGYKEKVEELNRDYEIVDIRRYEVVPALIELYKIKLKN